MQPRDNDNKPIPKASANSQQFFFSKNSRPIPTAHSGDLYELKNKNLPFNRGIYHDTK